MSAVQDAVAAFLSSPPYYACLLLVHPDVRRLESVASALSAALDWPRLSVGRDLSAALSDEPQARRSRFADLWMDSTLRKLSPGPILCSEIDLLFDPSLGLDPLALLRRASRLTTLAVAWPGTYVGDVLSYAVPDHSHYCDWRQPDVVVVRAD